MDSVKIAPLLAGVWSRPVSGTISGKLDPIDFKSGSLKTAGEIRAKVFDGDVVFSDLGASGLFAGTPVFRLNARWKDLSFSELTAGTSFGKIEGVLNGYAKDLEIAHGQPQKFDLLLETVEEGWNPSKDQRKGSGQYCPDRRRAKSFHWPCRIIQLVFQRVSIQKNRCACNSGKRRFQNERHHQGRRKGVFCETGFILRRGCGKSKPG